MSPTDLREARHLATYSSPSAQVDLQLDLGQFIAAGRTGLVYEVQSSTTVTASNGRQVHVPPLVCKFAARDRNKCISREAWFYDEMQTIQGLAIPHCFGLFEAILPENTDKDFIPWDTASKDHYNLDRTPDPYLKNPEKLYKDFYLGGFIETPANRTILTRLEDPNRVVVILLERLGGNFLPVRKPITDELKCVMISLRKMLVY